MRIGIGYDVHRLVQGRPLILGGLIIPHPMGLLGHSDADVLLHALCDALLGAAALGDIGAVFPDTDPSYKDVSSVSLLKSVVGLLKHHGYRPVNIDAVVFAETPRLEPFKNEMRGRIAAAMAIALARVSIKATTTEGLGYIGRGEGIGAMAVALIERHED